MTGCLAAWLVAGAGLVAGTGGFGSPLAAALLIPVVLTNALARPWLLWTGIAMAVAYGAAGALGMTEAAAGLGAFPAVLTLTSLALVAWLAARRNDRQSAAARWRVAEAAHELRTPLTHILGFAEMIERRLLGGDIGDRYVEYAQLIRRSGGQLLQMVTDLLDIGSIDAGRSPLNVERFDVRDVAAEVVRMAVESAVAKRIKLGLVTPEAPLLASADRDAIRRMLTNTVGNAIKFTPESGDVLVRVGGENGVLVLETSDSGPGFADAAQIGQAYERGGAREPGTGLGLALVRALAQAHGGDVSFGAAPGGGALVRVRLPVLSGAT
jgi:cell cycle sensor histidine kinase DivJ